MKVIAEGKGWTKRVTCKGCSAVLEAEVSDINYEITDIDLREQQYEPEIEGTYSIDCPECGQNLSIKRNDIPANIRQQIRK